MLYLVLLPWCILFAFVYVIFVEIIDVVGIFKESKRNKHVALDTDLHWIQRLDLDAREILRRDKHLSEEFRKYLGK